MKILLIEDDREDIAFIEAILPDSNLTILNSSPTDLNEVLSSEFDIIITDYFFEGGSNCRAFLEQLSNSQYSHIPVIIISGLISSFKLSDIPSNLNSLVLSKNENFKELLLHYIQLISSKRDESSEPDDLDYKTLLYSLVHDLKNDLTIVSFSRSTLVEKNSVDKNMVNEKMIAAASCAYDRVEMLSNFITFEEKEFFSLSEVVEKVKSSSLVCEYSENIKVMGESSKKLDFIPGIYLTSIIKNLVENSCKNKASDRKLKVQINFYENDEEHVLSIDDNAKGMSEEVSENLFSKTQKSDSGLGVGLVILNRIISSYNGHIAVMSERDVGTSIIIRFKK